MLALSTNVQTYSLALVGCVQIIYVKLSVVMGLGWVVGFVAAFVDWPGLWYVFIVINSLQGALLCVAFVATRQVTRLLADCVRPLVRRRVSGTATTTSNDLALKSRTSLQSQGEGTAVTHLSSPEII